ALPGTPGHDARAGQACGGAVYIFGDADLRQDTIAGDNFTDGNRAVSGQEHYGDYDFNSGSIVTGWRQPGFSYGGGVYIDSVSAFGPFHGSDTTLSNTLLAFNGAGHGPDLSGSITHSSHNLLSDGSGADGLSTLHGDQWG